MNPKKVLIIDDDPRVRRLLERITVGLGLRPTSLVIISDLAKLVEENRPDFVVIDLNLGKSKGVDLLRELAEKEIFPGVIIVSGENESIINSSRCYAMSLGLKVLGALQKPLDMDVFKSLLTEAHAGLEGTSDDQQSLSPRELQLALQNKDLEVFYQPKIDIWRGLPCGVEALVRWRHADHGILSPDRFIGLAERSGLIEPLTYFVIDQALKDINYFRSVYPKLGLAVNLSPTLLEDDNIIESISDYLKFHDFDPGSLTLEITESAMVNDLDYSHRVLSSLRLMGITIAIDDMGTGHSSLEKLFRLPYNEIKIDKQFLVDMVENSLADVIVTSTITLGHRLNVSVVAEGIEDFKSLYRLRSLGCHIGQGFYFSPPLPADELHDWLVDQDVEAMVSGPVSVDCHPGLSYGL